MFKFEEVGNYRGCLEVVEDSGKYYWRVSSEIHDERWRQIPDHLYRALLEHHKSIDGVVTVAT